LYGPMKPVGLEYPEGLQREPRRNGGNFKTPYAVVSITSR
ncbi:gid protein, partial [Streptococcus agalactiae H36B]